MTCQLCDDLRQEVESLRRALGRAEDVRAQEALRRALGLTPTEAMILLQLHAANGAVVDRWAIIDRLQRPDPYGKALHVHVCHIRRKVGAGAIVSRERVGYAITPEGAALVALALGGPS